MLLLIYTKVSISNKYICYLNTSNVTVNHSPLSISLVIIENLNTSNVTVNPTSK